MHLQLSCCAVYCSRHSDMGSLNKINEIAERSEQRWDKGSSIGDYTFRARAIV